MRKHRMVWPLWLPAIATALALAGAARAQEPVAPMPPVVEEEPPTAERLGPPTAPGDAAPRTDAGTTNVPLLSAARTGVRPDIDGVRSEALWDRCLSIGHFTRIDGTERALDQTDVYITYDDTNLYLAVSCYEPTLENLRSAAGRRDDLSIAQDDFVEVLLAPQRSAGPVTRIVVNPAGTVLDIGGPAQGLGWDCEGLSVRTARGNFRWHVEMSIPFASLGAAPAEGDVWAMNFARFKPTSGEYSCYAGADGDYANPRSFATVVFSGAPVLVDLVDVGDAFGELRGGSTMRVRFKATTAHTVTPLVRVIRGLDEQFYGTAGGTVDIVGHRDRRVEILYEVADPRGAQVQLAILDEQRRTLYLSPRLPLRNTWLLPQVAALRTELAKYRELFASVGAGAQGQQMLADALNEPAAQLVAIESSINSDQWGSLARWRQISDQLDTVGANIAKVSMVAALLKAATPSQLQSGQLPAYVVWNRPYMRPMTTTTPVDIDEVKPRTYLFGSPGEYEPASFAVTARTELRNVRVTVGDLTSGNATIPRDRVDVRVVKCWYQAGLGPQKEPGQRYFVPELLVKDDRVLYSGMQPDVRLTGDPVTDIPAGQSRQFWVTVAIPQGVPEGLYTGQMVIAPENAEARTQELQVKVLGIQLNEPLQQYYIYYRGVLTGTGPEVVSEETMRRDLRNISEHGFDQATMYEAPEGVERALRLRKELGMTEPIPFSLFALRPDDITSFVEGVQRLFVSQGLPDLWFSTVDEPNSPEELARSDALGQLVHKGGGKVFTTIDREYAILHGDTLDVPNYNVQGAGFREYIRDLLKGNAQADPRNEFYYWQCILEDTAVNRLFAGLYLPKSTLDGVCPHVYQYVIDSDDPYDDMSGGSPFRHHMVTYPSANGPVDTIQWECMREGRDDVRYFTTLQALMAEARAFTNDPAVSVRLTEAQQTIAQIMKTLQSDYRITLQSLDPVWYQEQRWEMSLRILRLQEAMAATRTAPVAPVAPVAPAPPPGV